MSLVEMMVAIGIFTIGMTGFTALFMNSWNHNKYTLEMGQTATAVSRGVNEITRYIREARQEIGRASCRERV